MRNGASRDSFMMIKPVCLHLLDGFFFIPPVVKSTRGVPVPGRLIEILHNYLFLFFFSQIDDLEKNFMLFYSAN